MKISIFLWITGLAMIAAMPSQGQSKLYIYHMENKIDSFALANVTKLVFNENSMQAQLKTGGLQFYEKSKVDAMILHNPTTTQVDWGEKPYPLLNVSVYPNPTTGKLFIHAEALMGTAQINIYNIYGVLIKQYTMNGKNKNIDISNFPSGMYYLQVVDKNSMIVTKMIKN